MDTPSPVIGHVVANADTWIKKSKDQSFLLGDDQKAFIVRGTRLEILAYGDLDEAHILVTLNQNIPTVDKSARYNTWYGYVGDENLWTIELYADEEAEEYDGELVDVRPATPNLADLVDIPIYGQVGLDDTVPGCTWATWREVTQDDPRRIPTRKSEVEAIVKIAKMLQPWRDKYGPLIVTSWLRPKAINRKVGGASRSRHIVGDAVDFYPNNGGLWEMQQDMAKNWGNNGGLGRGAKRGFIHADGRGGVPIVFDY